MAGEKKIEDGWYLACPKCHTLDRGEGWTEYYEVTKYYYPRVTPQDDDEPDIEYDSEEGGGELISIEHSCGFETEYETVDLAIKVKNGVITKVGYYWERHKDKLVELAEENGLTISPEILNRLLDE